MKDQLLINLESFLKSEYKIEAFRKLIFGQSNEERYKFFYYRYFPLPTKVKVSEFEIVDVTPKFIVDSIIQHYGFIMIGALTNYFPPILTYDLQFEIIRFFEIQEIRKYYKIQYPHFLPEAIVGYCFSIRAGKVDQYIRDYDHNESEDLFNEFLIFNRIINNDKQIQTFLRIFENEQIFLNQMKMLNSISSLEQIDFESNKSEEGNAFLGAVLFSEILNQLIEILDKAKKYPVLQSIIWHFYGYYFETNNKKMREFYKTIFGIVTGAYLDEISNLPEFYKSKLSFDDLCSGIITKSKKNIDSFLLFSYRYSIPLRRVVIHNLNRLGENSLIPF